MLAFLRILFRRSRGAVFGTLVVVVFLCVSALAPYIAPSSPFDTCLENALLRPSWGYPLGTDELGRDILSRIIWGARLSALAGAGSTVIALISGLFIGSLCAFFGGRLAFVIMRGVDALLAFPRILLALVLVALVGSSLGSLALAVGICGVPVFARLSYGSTLSAKGLEYIESARSVGATSVRIWFRHIVPNILSPLIVQASLAMAANILAISGLSFLGLGPPPPTPEWGAMVNAGRVYLRSDPHVFLAPGLALFVVILGFNLLGDGLRDALDPRMKQ